MREDSKRSHTAEGAAALRAAGARDEKLRNPDHLAERFIGGRFLWRVRFAPLRALSLVVTDRILPGLMSFITARTKHFDQIFLDEIRNGARQAVILGAGADSRAYRFADELGEARVYEVDHPATGEWKRRQVRRLFGEPPERVSYVPVDFGTQSLDDALDRAGVPRDVRTVVLWEGVAPYLPAEAVDATLATVAKFAAGSSLVFDYLYRDAFDDPARYPESRKYFGYLARHGEPLLSGLDPDGLRDHLAGHGFDLVDNAGPEELRRHLPDGTRRLLSFSAIAHARVASHG